jgi:dephospho-CoA kinase
MGGFCIYADKLAHQVMECGQPAYTEISDAFGPGILSPDGSIDRKALGDIVFRDPDLRRLLERIVHRQVIAESWRLTNEARASQSYAYIVWDAPLLIEAGMHLFCDIVLLVASSYALKLSRILARDGITEERARLRLVNQPTDSDLYEKLVSSMGESRVKIIENNGSIEGLAEKTYRAL